MKDMPILGFLKVRHETYKNWLKPTGIDFHVMPEPEISITI